MADRCASRYAGLRCERWADHGGVHEFGREAGMLLWSDADVAQARMSNRLEEES